MIYRKGLLLSSAVTALALGQLAPAFAQDAAAPTSPEMSTTVETVVVTAQRRQESAQEVPIAITAVSAEDLQAMGVNDTRGLTSAVPGLVMTSVGNVTQVYLRGIGTANTSVGDEQSTAIYVDGVYYTSAVGGLFALNNIQSIEVDKGPQGTLFGRNATGGVVQILTKDPIHETHIDASATYANFDTWRGTLYATGEVTSNLAGDIALYGNYQGDGWGTNIHNGRDVFFTQEYAARSKWLWNVDSDTTVRFTADYDRNKSDLNTTTLDVPPAKLVGLPVYPGFYNANMDTIAGADSKSGGFALTVDHDLQWAHLRNITSWRKATGAGLLDQDSTPAALGYISVPSYDRTITEEIQLLSPDDSWLNWIGGFYYYNDDAGYNHGGLQVVAAVPLFAVLSEQKNRSYAGFGQVTAEILPKLSATVGLRYTSDNRSIDATRITLTTNTVSPGYPVSGEQTFNKLTWKGALDYKFTDTIMGYVSYSRGFKGGLYNNVSPFVPGTFDLNVVKPEVLDALEIGAKSDWFDNRLRLNASFFNYQFKDIQIGQVILGGVVVRNAASAHINGVDLEVDAVPIPNLTISGSLEYLDAKFGSFLNAPFYTLLPGGGDTVGTGDASGLQLPQAPKFSGRILVQYNLQTDIGPVAVQGSYYYNDGYFFSPDNRLVQPSYSLLGASAFWSDESGKYDVRVWGKNLTNAEYYGYATQATTGDHGSPAEPRTFGVTLGVHF